MSPHGHTDRAFSFQHNVIFTFSQWPEATDLCLGQCWSPGKLHLGAWAHTSPLHWCQGLHHRLPPVAHACLEADSPEPRCCHCSKRTKNTPKHPTLNITQRHINLLHSVNIFSSRKNLEENHYYYLCTKKSTSKGEEGKRRTKTLHFLYEESWLLFTYQFILLCTHRPFSPPAITSSYWDSITPVIA